MNFRLEASARAGKATDVRAEGKIPAVVYGREREPQSIAFDYVTFEKLYSSAGTSSLITLSVDGKEEDVLIKDWQMDPVKNQFAHVDFYAIVKGQEVDSEVSLKFVGVSPAVKLGGTLMTGIDTLSISCLPNDLVHDIEVDLSVLASFDDVITVADIKAPAGITINDNHDLMIAKVNAPLTAEQLEKLESSEEADVSSVEVEEKGKKKEEDKA